MICLAILLQTSHFPEPMRPWPGSGRTNLESTAVLSHQQDMATTSMSQGMDLVDVQV